MMPQALRDRFEIILVEPESAGNIGASARAMHNMGFHRLGLVNPVPYKNMDAYKMAWNSREILDQAAVYASVPEAVADKGWVIALTRRKGKDRGFLEVLDNLVPEMRQTAQNASVALLFGRESRGLENDELRYADRYAQIPTAGQFASLNLSQAVLLTCHTLFASGGIIPEEGPQVASHGELEEAFDHIRRALALLGYGARGSRLLPENILDSIRRIAGRARPDHREVQMVRGLCSQVEKLAAGPGSAGDLRHG